MQPSHRQLTRVAWIYPAAGVLISFLILVAGPGLQTLIAAAGMLAIIPAGLIARRVHGFPRPFAIGLGAVGALYVLEAVAVETIAVAFADAVDLVATGVIIGLVAFMAGRQRGGFHTGDILDGIIVGAGGWLVSWVVFVEPFLDEAEQGGMSLIIGGMYLPTTLVIFVLGSILLFGGGRPGPSASLLAAGLACNVFGDFVYALEDIRRLGLWSYTVADMFYFCSVAACGGAFIHPSASALIRATPIRRELSLLSRLSLVISSLIVPIVLIALVPSSSPGDRYVRAGSALFLLVVVGVRFHAAVRSQLNARLDLELSIRTDELTSLPNKRALIELADESIEERWRSSARPSLYLFDLDGFKNINDSLGHMVGDEVLEVLARRLGAAAHAIGAVATRVSGDEFVVFDATPITAEQADRNARAIHQAFDEPLQTSAGELYVTASCGVACMPGGAPSSSDELFRWADIAKYQAKAAGRSRLVMYEPSMQEGLSTRMEIENSLHGALDRRELMLFHQPIIDITTGRVEGVEALMRWQRPDGTMVAPNDFIPVAEETGIINSIGTWAILDALTQLRTWIDDGVVPRETTMSVNVSPCQLADPSFPGAVSEALGRSGIPANLLWLEVTESIMIQNPELARHALQQIRAMGVQIALDDFGTGYSSLSLLQQFPIQRIKIDRAFVSSIVENANDRTLVRTVIGLGKSMGIDVVAEGVETAMQLQMLRQLGCAKAQGYLIARPAPPDAIRSTIAALDSLAQWPEFGQLMGDSSITRPAIAPTEVSSAARTKNP